MSEKKKSLHKTGLVVLSSNPSTTKKEKRAGGVARVVEHQPNKGKALSSTQVPPKEKKYIYIFPSSYFVIHRSIHHCEKMASDGLATLMTHGSQNSPSDNQRGLVKEPQAKSPITAQCFRKHKT
jgi:hypothetical protein